MAGNKRNVFLDFIVNDKQARQGLQGVANEAGKTEGRFSKLSGGAKALVGGFAALAATKVISFLGDAAMAAAEDQKAQELLALAVKNSTDATKADIAGMEAWIKKTSIATGVADDELRPALAELARTTGDLETAQETLGVAMDIAAAKGIPLETVTKAIGKAALGNVGALGRLGVATKDADGKTMSFKDTLAEAARTMGGATATSAETAAGKMKILQVQMDEAKESIGAALIPILADLAQQGSDTAKVMGFLGEKIGDALPGSKGFGSSIMEWVGPLAVSGKLMEIAAAKVDELTEASEKSNKVLEVSADRYDDMSGSVDDATDALQDFEDEIRSQIDPMFNLIDKVNDLDEAQAASARARDEYGDGSLEHREALRKEASAWLSVKDAQIKAANEAGLTRDAFRKVLQDMKIFTSKDIDLILEDFDRVNNYTFRDKTIRVNTRGDIINRDRGPDTKRARGGPVRAGQTALVGEEGPEIVTFGSNGMVHPNGSLGGGGTLVQVSAGTLVGSGGMKELAKIIGDELEKRSRRNGF